jgi:hypothetical protein
VGVGLAWGLVVGVLVVWGWVHFDLMDMSANRIVEQFGYEVLLPLPPSALFLTMTDLVTNTLRYLQVTQHVLLV